MPAVGRASGTKKQGVPASEAYDSLLAIEPHAPATIYAGMDGGVFRSTDGAAGGVIVKSFLPQDQKIIPDTIECRRGKGMPVGARGAASLAGALSITFTR